MVSSKCPGDKHTLSCRTSDSPLPDRSPGSTPRTEPPPKGGHNRSSCYPVKCCCFLSRLPGLTHPPGCRNMSARLSQHVRQAVATCLLTGHPNLPTYQPAYLSTAKSSLPLAQPYPTVSQCELPTYPRICISADPPSHTYQHAYF